jgi:integrase
VGIYNRALPGAQPNLWISYSITEELRVKYGTSVRTVREACAANNQRAAQALLAQRRREVRDGTWAPARVARAQGSTLAEYVATWIAGRKRDGVLSARNEEQRLRDHVLPVLGSKLMTELRRQDVRDLVVNLQRVTSKASGKMLAPRTVHRVYEDLRAVCSHAVEVSELLPANPCTIKVSRGELPKKIDRDPRWRSGAVFTRDEAETLISSDRVPLPRRVLYGLMLLMGCRVGEAVGRRWRDYDLAPVPLGRMSIATQYDDRPLKTENPREAPVHPVLARMLASWKLEGFPLFYGRAPKPEDFIVPNQRTMSHQIDKRVWQNLQRDLAALGMRKRRVHDMRRTLVTLARAGGARPDILKWITHGPDAGMMDHYMTPTWDVLCEQITCLKVELRMGATVHQLRRKEA